MNIVIAPDSFKESLSAREVCDAIVRGVRRMMPDSHIDAIPMADGGEGTVEAMLAATGGTRLQTPVTGPLGEAVFAVWGMLGDGQTAVLEMAAASGLGLVPPEHRNPLHTSTFGTGELIRAALDAGASKIIVGIGGSATNDGGAGAAQAVGVQFFDAQGRLCAPGLSGGRLNEIARIDVGSRDPRIAHTSIAVACDVNNPLCGPKGAAAIYGPQKGATPEQVQLLDRNLAQLAELIRRDLGKDIREIPGSGAAGGLGAGLLAFFDARIERGIQLMMDAVQFSERIRGADLVITGEGKIDRQSMMGKVIAGVGGAAKAANVPVVALVGTVGDGADETLAVLDSYHCITPAGTPKLDALSRANEFLEAATVTLLNRLSL